MMKKLLLFLPLLFILVLPQVVLADDSLTTGSVSATTTPSPTPLSQDYTLPYPGLLPDSPLYFLKTFRDQVIAFFISDPVKKSSFYLLQSDKRLESSWYLLKEGRSKDALALSTLSKSNNYVSLSLSQAQLAIKSGENLNGLGQQLRSAIAKHEVVVAQMAQNLSGNNKNTALQEDKRLDDFAKSAATISTQQ